MRLRTVLFALLLLAGGALVVWRLRVRAAAARATAATTAATPPRPIPVAVSVVERRDVPVYLEGLGTVAAFYSVTVRSRVDGLLNEVAFREGQNVHRGDVLARIDPRPFAVAVSQAEAVVARDRAQLHTNQIILERDRGLRSNNLIAQQDVDNAQAAADTVASSVRADLAAVASARLTLSFAQVVSPIDGVTGLRQVDPGNLVHPTDPNGLVVVAQVDPISVLFTLPQDELPRVMREMARGPLRVDVLSRDGLTQLGTGQLALVDNQINANTATIRMKAVVPNPDRQLWPNQFVKVRLLVTVRQGALVVPAAAIQRGPQGTFVYVVDAEQRARVRPVEFEQLAGELAVITGGELHAGEQVVSDGQNLLSPGARVAPRGSEAGGPGARGDGGVGGGGDGGRRGRRDAGGAP